jgi:omega-6 fatty acid desaturase (delta-12 desaturase)
MSSEPVGWSNAGTGPAVGTIPAGRGIGERVSWAKVLAPWARPRLGRSGLDLLTSVVPYVALSVLMYALLDVSYLLVLALAVPAAGFLLRTYIVFHDCAHGSFLPSKRANTWLGVGMGLVVLQPFHKWRHDHAVHHATAGDLDRRGVGDVMTLTVSEYRGRSARARLGYWLFRNPLVMFGLGPIWAMLVAPRIVSRSARPRIRRTVIATNVALLVFVGALCWLIGWQAYLAVWGPPAWIAAAAGVWLFYVQHQYEDAYWENTDSWSYADAALRGSSHLKLPALLQFFTGNIGLHHVHHLSTRIPNYNLQSAHDNHQVLQDVPVLTIREGIQAVRLKLWDAARGRLVTFAEARQPIEWPIATSSTSPIR